METRAPERTETNSGVLRIAEARADRLLNVRHARAHLLGEGVGVTAALGKVGVADLGGDGEAGRDGNGQGAHLRQAGAFAAQQIAQIAAALALPVAKRVDERFGRRCAARLGRVGRGHLGSPFCLQGSLRAKRPQPGRVWALRPHRRAL